MSNYDIDLENAVEEVLAEYVQNTFNVEVHNYIVSTKTVDQEYSPSEPEVGLRGDSVSCTVESVLTDRATGLPKFKLVFNVSGFPDGEENEGSWDSWLNDTQVELVDAKAL